MMRKPKHPIKVSVLMSVYNGDKYLREAINSILNQTFTDFEFIIINDGSTDKTKEILESYSDPRIRLFHQENIGLTKSLNRGLKIARGKYIARQDADDISLPKRLEMQLVYLDKHPEVVLLGTAYQVIDESGQVMGTKPVAISHKELSIRILFDNVLAHSTAMFRTTIAKELKGYDVTIFYAQDYDLWWRLSQRGRIETYPKVLISWRQNLCRGISFTKNEEQRLCAEQIALRATRAFMCEESINESAYRRLILVYRGELNQLDPQDARALEPFWRQVGKKAGLPLFLWRLLSSLLENLADRDHKEGFLLFCMLCKCFGREWLKQSSINLLVRLIIGPNWTQRLRNIKHTLVRP